MTNQKYPKIAKYLNQHYMKRMVKHGRDYSQTELAAEMGITQAALSKLMQGNTRPRIDTIEKIAGVTGLDFYDVCDVPRIIPNDPLIRKILEGWKDLNKDEQRNLYEAYEEKISRHRQNEPNGTV